jgi:hypothetical protein
MMLETIVLKPDPTWWVDLGPSRPGHGAESKQKTTWELAR